MRYLLGFFLLLQVPGYPTQPYPYSSGVVIRVDGSVVIDEWTFYDSTPGSPNPTKKYPTSITVGRSIKNPVNVCIEFENGTVCKDIGDMRALIQGQKK